MRISSYYYFYIIKSTIHFLLILIHEFVDPGGPMVIILATGSEVRRFRPSRGRWIFQNLKILSMTSFGREISRGSRVIDLWHIKEPRASEQNLSDFSCLL